uniref:Uncharacterized protein n=2 Tax=viral metagenome TaxID=1070528 RepID=A0A6M3Y5V9_9ZZZZ
MEDLILAKAGLGTIANSCQEEGMDTPEWVVDKLTLVSAEITNRNRADLQKRLRMLRAQEMADATPSERRRKRAQEIAELEKKLG